MPEFTLVFRSACAPATASRQLRELEPALAEAGGQAAGHVGGEYSVCGKHARGELINIMEAEGFILDRIITLTG